MKMKLMLSSVLAAASLALMGGCVERTVYVQQPPPGQPGEVVTASPPAPQVEVIGVAPGPGYYWVPGYWAWQGRWVWIGGCWTIRPHPHAVWVGGRWAHHAHGYVWVRGYWR